MLLQDFRPQDKLVTRATAVDWPRFPVIDAHNHPARPFGHGWNRRPVREVLDRLDEAGSTHYVDLDEYRLSYRFLETDDEYFNYSTGEIPLQGRWFVCGLHLPDDVLKKVYSANACAVLHIG